LALVSILVVFLDLVSRIIRLGWVRVTLGEVMIMWRGIDDRRKGGSHVGGVGRKVTCIMSVGTCSCAIFAMIQGTCHPIVEKMKHRSKVLPCTVLVSLGWGSITSRFQRRGCKRDM
jgi:hypothetical protein